MDKIFERFFGFGKLEVIAWNKYIRGNYEYVGNEESFSGQDYYIVVDRDTFEYFCTKDN